MFGRSERKGATNKRINLTGFKGPERTCGGTEESSNSPVSEKYFGILKEPSGKPDRAMGGPRILW